MRVCTYISISITIFTHIHTCTVVLIDLQTTCSRLLFQHTRTEDRSIHHHNGSCSTHPYSSLFKFVKPPRPGPTCMKNGLILSLNLYCSSVSIIHNYLHITVKVKGHRTHNRKLNGLQKYLQKKNKTNKEVNSGHARQLHQMW